MASESFVRLTGSRYAASFNGSVAPPGEEVPACNNSFFDFGDTPPSSPPKPKGFFGSLRSRARSNPEKIDEVKTRNRSKTNPFEDKSKFATLIDSFAAASKPKIPPVDSAAAAADPTANLKVPKIQQTPRIRLAPLTPITVQVDAANKPYKATPGQEKDLPPTPKTPGSRSGNGPRIRPKASLASIKSNPEHRHAFRNASKENNPPPSPSRSLHTPTTPKFARRQQVVNRVPAPVATPRRYDLDPEGEEPAPQLPPLPSRPSSKVPDEPPVLGSLPLVSPITDSFADLLRGAVDPFTEPELPQTPAAQENDVPVLWARDSLRHSQLERINARRVVVDAGTAKPPRVNSLRPSDPLTADADLSVWWSKEGDYYANSDSVADAPVTTHTSTS